MRYRALGLAVLVAAATLIATPARSATDLVYVRSSPGLLPKGRVAGRTVQCPSGTYVLSGGVNIIGKNTATGVSQSYPIDAATDPDTVPDDGWRGVAISRSQSDKSIVVHAVCTRSSPRPVYRSAFLDGIELSINSASAACPDGSFATGGGPSFPALNGVSLVRTYPQDDLTDDDTITDDGWVSSIDNETSTDFVGRAHAVCARSGIYRYVRSTVLVSFPSQGNRHASCAAGYTAAGGGVFTNGEEIAATIPYDNADPGAVPEDGWRAYVNEVHNPSDPITTHAVCKH